jgi:hypothetical protein
MFVNHTPMTWSPRKIMGNQRTIKEMDIYESEDADEGEIEK